MEDNKENSYNSYLNNTSAFSSLNNISTSYNQGLSKSIMDLVNEKEDGLFMSDILDKYGSYPQIHNQVKRLILDNKLIIYETVPHSLANADYKTQKIKTVDATLSQWLDMSAQPCLTCPHTSECAISNPVSPSTCNEFNFWLESEIELDMLD